MGWRIICIEMASRINYKLNSIGIIQKEEILWINLDDLDDIIIFKFYSRKIPNIMISNEIINIDLNLLSNQLLLNWPTNIENSKIENIVKRFFRDFSREMCTNNIELYTVYTLIIKLLNLSIECKFEEENYLPEIYKNYINSL